MKRMKRVKGKTTVIDTDIGVSPQVRQMLKRATRRLRRRLEKMNPADAPTKLKALVSGWWW